MSYGQVNWTNSSSITSGVSSIAAEKFSTFNRHWQEGGIFYGLKPEQEILALRTANSKKFDIGNGKKQVIIGGPFHYMDAQSHWQDIDLTIGKNGNAIFPFYNNTNTFETEFGKDHLTGVRMKYKSNEIKFGLNTAISCNNWIPESSESKVINQENILIYKEIYKGIDLEYELNDKSVLHRLKFKNKESLLNVPYESKYLTISENIEIPIGSLLFDSIGLISKNRKTFGNIFISLNGDTIFTIIASKIWDASFDELNEKRNDNIIIVNSFVEFTSKSSFQLIAKIPIDWLTSEDRTFPVTFDPTVTKPITKTNESYLGSSGDSYPLPWKTNYADKKTQTIYSKGDINFAGNITDIEYLQACNNSLTNSNITISMRENSSSSFSSFINSGWQTCYNNSNPIDYTSGASSCSSTCPTTLKSSSGTWRSISIPSGSQWNYSNNQNLMIQTVFNNSTYKNSKCDAGAWWYYTTSSYTTIYDSQDNAPFSSTGISTNNAPVIKITLTSSSSCSSWSTYPTYESFTSNGKSNNSFSVNYTGTSCTFSAYSNDNWIKNVIYSVPTKTVTYDIVNNPNYFTRDGYIYVLDANKNLVSTFTVYQDALSCSMPAFPTNFKATAISKSQIDLSWSDNASNETSYKVERYLSSGGWVIIADLAPNSESYSDNGLSPSTTYSYRISACCDTKCAGVSAISEKTKDPGPTITITSAIVPPWQREGDDLMGSITADYSYMSSGKIIQLDIYINGNYAGTKSSKTTSGSSGTLIFDFDFKMISLTPSPAQGDKIGYQLIENTSAASADVDNKTNIIERRWNYKNFIYYDNLSIPVAYDPQLIPDKLVIYRSGTVSGKLKKPKWNSPYLIENHEGFIYYPMPGLQINNEMLFTTNDGYVNINQTNSNLATLAPGYYQINIWSKNTFIETVYFDLTKIGRFFQPANMNKVVILIGGIFNEMEVSAKVLDMDFKKNSDATNSNSDISFSLCAYLNKSKEFDFWYIAQGNANSIIYNGYDVGMAFEEIRKKYPSNTEFNFICHSKGGLDLRAFLEGFNLSYDERDQIYYSNKMNIKKVLFLGTPHLGSATAGWLEGINATFFDFPGAEDLRHNSIAINNLNSKFKNLPSEIEFLNLAGYKNYLSATTNRIGTNYLFYKHVSNDGFVDITDNDFFFIEGLKNNINVKQLYQNSEHSSLFGWPHFELHKNNYLTYKDGYHDKLNCLDANNTNLKKIYDFFSGNAKFSTCSPRPSMSDLLISTYKSIVSGAKISIKPNGESQFYHLGLTDESGNLSIKLLPSLQIGDSIKIEANGTESMTIGANEELTNSKRIAIPMIHDKKPTSKIQFPAIELENVNQIVYNSSIKVRVKGKNVISYKINSPLSQDSLFIPVLPDSGFCLVKLDTGYNYILIKFEGIMDTVILGKQVFYLPGVLKNEFTYSINVLSDSNGFGTKIYVNNLLSKEIKDQNSNLSLLKGRNEIRLSKLGYRDTILFVDSNIIINLNLQQLPISFSSETDSFIFDFSKGTKIQYTRNLTCFDSIANNIISIKEYDDNLLSRLIPQSRKFEFTHLNSPKWSNIRVAGILDQEENFSKSDAYLLDILDDTLYAKFPLEENGIADYDSAVQKFSFDSLNFGHGNAKKETLVLVRKQAPVAIKKSFNIQVNDSSLIPYSLLFTDPDSVKNDMAFEILNPAQKNFTYHLTDNGLFVKPDKCYTGKLSILIKATHDWLNTIQSYDIDVPEVLPNLNVSGSANFCKGDSIKFTAHKSHNHTYRWYRNNILLPAESKHELVTHIEGKYHLGLTSSASGCTYSSDTINILTTGTERWKDHCLRIFPNPSHGWVTVQMEGIKHQSNLTIEVFDVWGRLIKIFSRTIEPTYLIKEQYDLNAFENGIYLFRTTLNNEQAITRKLNISR